VADQIPSKTYTSVGNAHKNVKYSVSRAKLMHKIENNGNFMAVIEYDKSYDLMYRVGFLPWQKVFLPGQWKNRQKLAKTMVQ